MLISLVSVVDPGLQLGGPGPLFELIVEMRLEGIWRLRCLAASICRQGLCCTLLAILGLALVAGFGDGGFQSLFCLGFALICSSLTCRPAVAARGSEREAAARLFSLFFERFLLPCAARMYVLLTAGVLLRRRPLLRLPPPARGWCGGLDGKPLSSAGDGGVVPSVSSAWHHWGWKPPFLSSTLTVGRSRPTSKVLRGPIFKPSMYSGKSTSRWRPFQRLDTAFNVGLKASGFVPAFFLDGGCPDLWLDDGNRGGPVCVVRFFRVFSPTSTRDLCVFFFLLRSSVILCTATVYY
jgi:hypothetical protein